MVVGEPAREYITCANGLAAAVRYHGIDVNGEQLGNRILSGSSPHMHFVREGFTLKVQFPIVKL